LQSREIADADRRRGKAIKAISQALSEVASLENDAGIPAVVDRTFAGALVSEQTVTETLMQKLILGVTEGSDRDIYDQLGSGARERRLF
jgi:hypothetical protein